MIRNLNQVSSNCPSRRESEEVGLSYRVSPNLDFVDTDLFASKTSEPLSFLSGILQAGETHER